MQGSLRPLPRARRSRAGRSRAKMPSGCSARPVREVGSTHKTLHSTWRVPQHVIWRVFALFLLAVAAFAPGIFDGINHLPGIMGEVQRLSAVDVPLLAGDELAERR